MRSPRRLASAALLVAALVLLGAACGGGGGGGGEAQQPTTTAAGGQGGNADQGKAIFDSQGCASCHTLQAAGASGTVGPNLDTQLADSAQKAGKPLADFTRESIVDPSAFVAEGFSSGVMPSDFGQKLSDQQLNDLVTFIVQSVSS